MKKRFLLVFFFNLISQIVFSGVKPEHDAWFEQIIVGGNLIENHSKEYIDDKKNQKTTYFFQTPEIINNLKTVAPEEYEKISLIEDALTIAIDQNNGKNQKLYEGLKRRLNNPKLTPPFEKINFTTPPWKKLLRSTASFCNQALRAAPVRGGLFACMPERQSA